LSTRAGVVQYLTSLGVDPRGIVVQRGSHNYAGPSCPGRGWTCTTAKRVLQIAKSKDDNNNFVCASSSGPGSGSGGNCQIFQFAPGGNNTATCIERSGDVSANQSCAITQDNTTGANRATIQQQVDAKDGGSTQYASQYGGVRQDNGTGSNDAQISQDIKQSLKKKDTDASGTQQQDGHQAASVSQDSDTGSNSARVDQSLAQSADAKWGTTLSQLQNTDGNVNSNVGVVQFSTSGRNDARVNQSNKYDAHIGKADAGNQQQGSPGSGENTFFLQDSTGLSTIQSSQKEDQNLHSEHVASLTQSQYGPQWADPEQSSNPNDTYNINQDSSQRADTPDTQDDQQYAECTTTGNCKADEHIQQQGQQQNNSCSGVHCDVANHFITADGETSQGACTSTPITIDEEEFPGTCASEGTPSPPPPPSGD